MYSKKQMEDVIFGKKMERIVRPHLEKYFKESITSYGDEFSRQDFHSYKSVYELKSRKDITSKTYSTIMIGCNKAILNDDDLGKTLYFCFYFTDGLFYIKYNKEQFKNWIKPFRRTDRGSFDKPTNVFYIPNHLLTKIEIKKKEDEIIQKEN